jgi:hypothetical protein
LLNKNTLQNAVSVTPMGTDEDLFVPSHLYTPVH